MFAGIAKIEAVDPPVVGRKTATRGGKKYLQGIQGFGLPPHRAQDIECDDIAGAFPDRVQRRLAEQARHRAAFDITAATQAFHCFINHAGRAFADPIFGDGREQPRQRFPGVERRCQPERQHGCRLALNREIS